MSFITIKELHVHADLGNVVRLLSELIERSKHMPTIQEVKDAVAEAVAAERTQVAAAITKAVEDALANHSATISEEDKEAILASIRSVVEPA